MSRYRVLTSAMIAIATLATISISQAQTSDDTKSTANGKDLSSKSVDKVTCADFLGYEDTFKPKVVAWAAGYKQGQKQPDAVAIDIDGVERVTPIIVESCKKEPSASLWSRIDEEFKKIF